MVSISLDEIKKNKPEELEEEDIKTLKENWGDLDEEEKEFYKDYAPEKEEDKLKSKVEGEEEEETEEEGDKGKKEPPAAPAITEDKIKSMLSDFKKDIEGYMEKRDPQKPATESEKKWFGKEFDPKNWDEFAEQFYTKALDRMRSEAEERKKVQDEKIQEANKKITDELNKIEEVPAEGTKERTEFERDFTQWAIEYGVTGSVPKAYELYKKTQAEKGKVPERQKQTQSKVGKSGGGAPSSSKEKTYSTDVRGKSMDDIIAGAVDKWENL